MLGIFCFKVKSFFFCVLLESWISCLIIFVKLIFLFIKIILRCFIVVFICDIGNDISIAVIVLLKIINAVEICKSFVGLFFLIINVVKRELNFNINLLIERIFIFYYYFFFGYNFVCLII